MKYALLFALATTFFLGFGGGCGSGPSEATVEEARESMEADMSFDPAMETRSDSAAPAPP